MPSWLIVAGLVGSSMVGALAAETIKRVMNRTVDPILDTLSRNRRDHLAIKRTLEDMAREFPINGESLPSQMDKMRCQIEVLSELLQGHLSDVERS